MFSGAVYIHPYKVTQVFIAADPHSSQFRPLVLHTILIASPWRKVKPNTLHLSSLLQTLSTTREALKQNTCSWWEKASCTAEPLEFQKTVELFANTVEIILKNPQTSSCKDAFWLFYYKLNFGDLYPSDTDEYQSPATQACLTRESTFVVKSTQSTATATVASAIHHRGETSGSCFSTRTSSRTLGRIQHIWEEPFNRLDTPGGSGQQNSLFQALYYHFQAWLTSQTLFCCCKHLHAPSLAIYF